MGNYIIIIMIDEFITYLAYGYNSTIELMELKNGIFSEKK